MELGYVDKLGSSLVLNSALIPEIFCKKLFSSFYQRKGEKNKYLLVFQAVFDVMFYLLLLVSQVIFCILEKTDNT